MCYDILFLERKADRLAVRYDASLTRANWNVNINDFEKTLPGMPKNASVEERIRIHSIWHSALDSIELPTYYSLSGFAHKPMVIICHEGMFTYIWGLVPRWAKHIFWDSTLNARSGEVFETPSFKHLIMSQRCIVPVHGFFESRHYGKETYPYKIFSKEQEIISLAGLWDTWFDPESHEIYGSFTILTTEANQLMAQIHNTKLRMPVILRPEDEARWLDPSLSKEDVISLLKPYGEQLAAYTVSKNVNSRNIEKKNHPSVLEPFHFDIPELIS